jgi:hypothetical protein
MVGGGIAAALLACQIASDAYKEYEREEPSYTTRHAYPHSSPTASVNTCATACAFVCSTSCIGEDYESRY